MKRFLILLLYAFTLSTSAETLNGYVVGISDGDTITVVDANRQQYKIRLAGIDAPEKGQAFGERSKDHLASMVFNKNVTIEWNKQDRYGRTVGKIIASGKDVNLAQIQAGLAWWYEKYRKEQSPTDQRVYEQGEQLARSQRLGLWGDKNPTPPWEFRHAKSEVLPEVSCPCSGSATCTGPKGGKYCITDGGRKTYR